MDLDYCQNLLDNIEKEEAFSFSKHTTYSCGGNAKIAYYPSNVAQAKAVFECLRHNNIKSFIIGNGSNILASDTGFNGAVISTKKLCRIQRMGRSSILCFAGATVANLLKYCVKNGLTGLEYLAGIPATVGGLTYMNGGAGGKYISENIKKVFIYDHKIRGLTPQNCNFKYKYSTMRDINCLILAIELKVEQVEPYVVKQNILKRLTERGNLPKGASCGCVFKNYKNISAGSIIESVGLKGYTLGCVHVSDIHANFIINRGGTANDVHKLIDFVKREVFSKTGIVLEEEVIYIGEF